LNREKQLEVKILSGMRDGHQFTFTGECSDQIDFAQPGDVILILRCPDKGAYSWNGNDLGLELTISWIESVTGFLRTLADHPSGVPKTLSWAGDILLNGAQVRGLGLGMPLNGGGFGDLIITIKVTQPEAGANTKSLLLQALTESQKTTTEGGCILTRV
jgi:molecular chaperone DnaJ